jgi:hypothetical protein
VALNLQTLDMSLESGSPKKGRVKFLNRVLSRKEFNGILQEDELYARFLKKRDFYAELAKDTERQLTELTEKATSLTKEEEQVARLSRAVRNVRKRLKELTTELSRHREVARGSRVRMNRRVTAEGAVLRARLKRAQAEVRITQQNAERRHTELFHQSFNARINGDRKSIPNREEWLSEDE